MKKVLSIVLAALLSIATILTASAAGITADEQKIIDALSKKITLASGATATLPADYINQAEDYLSKVDLKTDDVSNIIANIQSAQTSVAKSNATTPSQFSNTIKDEVVAQAKQAATVIDATLSVSSGYTASLKFNPTAAGGYAGKTISSDTTVVIKQTGVEGNVVLAVVASVILMAAAGYVFTSSRKAESK